MTALLVRPKPARRLGEPSRVHWTRDEFYRFFNDPVFEGRKFILIDGEIIEMANPGPPHDVGMTMLNRLLARIDGQGCVVRNQQGLTLGFDTDPIPDFAVVAGGPRDYYPDHPTTALMVIEVSDSSLRYDLREKFHLYAASGIPEYWVLDAIGRELHVFTNPVADPSALRGHRYADRRELAAGDEWNLKGIPFRVADLLP